MSVKRFSMISKGLVVGAVVFASMLPASTVLAQSGQGGDDSRCKVINGNNAGMFGVLVSRAVNEGFKVQAAGTYPDLAMWALVCR